MFSCTGDVAGVVVQEMLLVLLCTGDAAGVVVFRKCCWCCCVQEMLLVLFCTGDVAGVVLYRGCCWCSFVQMLLVLLFFVQEMLLVSDLERHGDVQSYAAQVDALLDKKAALVAALRGRIAAFRG